MEVIRISIGEYHTVEYSEPNEHIHGHLNIEIGGRRLPYLGYWGPHDVCFNDWFEELSSIIEQFENSGDTVYCFEEGEQGQPVFEFKYDGENVVSVSIVESQLSGHPGDPDWQNIEVSFSEFKNEIKKASIQLLNAIESTTPALLKEWKKTVRIVDDK
jgi:hypothetical protein